ncbi:hypothetical protein [Pseudoclavibacter sp. VKM Ac-2888]|uniref:hypothetical protein n=1 Tax=Pseudoclavibacter sp. VKM Ac-2888 TaxID=2783830 RepID=UPI00188D7D39|nr:hypothetical protein [Pseudoclavibacter sp. VKM Ac-2888]MBF4549338.1 hypothetical protein [Pseudoclavibacter sp. VKM Ac-2888]
MTNLKIVENLDEHGRCLFDHQVYPGGGVGYKDSSLPYDDFEEEGDRLLNTLRAEVLRNNSSSILDVFSDPEADGLRVIVVGERKAAAEGNTVDQLLAKSTPGQQALDGLRKMGVRVDVEHTAQLSLESACEVEARVKSAAEQPETRSTFFYSVNAAEGRLKVVVPKGNTAFADTITKQDGDKVLLEYVDGELEQASRGNGNPRMAGAYMKSWTGSCSTAFRVNSNKLITNHHCDRAGGASWGAWYGSQAMGFTSQNLWTANVDIQLLQSAGSYSGRMYTGQGVLYGDSSSSLPAYGIYPTYLLKQGDNLIFSGGLTGQANATYNTDVGCAYLADKNGNPWWTCQMFRTELPGGIGTQGDSGSPYAAYDPANGRVIPAGIHTGGQGGDTAWHNNHSGFATHMLAISYLYGGANIG